MGSPRLDRARGPLFFDHLRRWKQLSSSLGDKRQGMGCVGGLGFLGCGLGWAGLLAGQFVSLTVVLKIKNIFISVVTIILVLVI